MIAHTILAGIIGPAITVLAVWFAVACFVAPIIGNAIRKGMEE